MIPWEDISELHVCRAVGRVVADRLGLLLSFAGTDGERVPPPGPGLTLATPLDVRAAGQGLRARSGRRPARLVALPDGGRFGIAAIDLAGRRSGYALAEASEPGRSPMGDEASAWLLDLLRLVADEAASFADEALGSPLPLREPGDRESYDDALIGASRPMRKLYTLLDKVAPARSTILIQGENGTGKELVARAIHRGSPRAARPFVVQNCSAFNDNLLASELFGHRKGAFTGAISDKPGLFDVAHGGTFFLDEIGDTSPAMQVKLLRVLQEGAFLPVGGTEQHVVDVRIVAASNRNLESMVRTGEFRQDLYYRLHVIALQLPPLRRRKDDIPILVEHFLARQSAGRRVGRKRLDEETLALFVDHDWPGNVRELENEIERLVVLAADHTLITKDLVSERIRHGVGWDLPGGVSDDQTLPAAVEALERSMIEVALRRSRWNKTRAAEDLGVSRRNLIRKVQAYGLERRR